jgi:hypothetical protein
VLYQLSYVGVCRDFPDFPTPGADFGLHGGCKILVGRRSGQGSRRVLRSSAKQAICACGVVSDDG